jgi:hypothetical protein
MYLIELEQDYLNFAETKSEKPSETAPRCLLRFTLRASNLDWTREAFSSGTAACKHA